MVRSIVDKAFDGGQLEPHEIAQLFEAPATGDEAAAIRQAAESLSRETTDGVAEVFVQIALNVAPCHWSCSFCQHALRHQPQDVVKSELTVDQLVTKARDAVEQGANAISLMSIAHYPFSKLLEMGHAVREELGDETVLLANTRDLLRRQAQRLKAAGFTGLYHALRLGEGKVTRHLPEARAATIQFAKRAGLAVGTAVEPIGPENTVDQLVANTLASRDFGPVFGGAVRRVPANGRPADAKSRTLAPEQMAHLGAVVRLALGRSVAGHYLHEPDALGTQSGANVLWSVTGPSKATNSWGLSVGACRDLLSQAGWTLRQGPSHLFG